MTATATPSTPAPTLLGRLMARESIGSLLDKNRGYGPGFDLLRIGLALIIMRGHCHAIAKIDPNAIAPGAVQTFDYVGLTRPFHVALVPMFFALSGFLVLGSAFRVRSVVKFLSLRALRIFPALAVETTLSAVLLGSLFSTLPAAEYFTHPEFFRYFGNIIGVISMTLPGVFTTNPLPLWVNVNLWTLPSEFDCYLYSAVLMVAGGVLYNRKLFTILFVVATLVIAFCSWRYGFAIKKGIYSNYTITYYFFCGALLYHWRYALPLSLPWLAVIAVPAFFLLISNLTLFVAPLFLAYCTVAVGCLNLPRIPLLKTGDYSYGVYLYGFPISQALMATFPFFLNRSELLFLVAGLVTIAVAVLSWHLVEKRVLTLKRFIVPKRELAGPDHVKARVLPQQA